MGENLASKLVYTYTDPLENHIDKKGMKIISGEGLKETAITYSSRPEDFDRFLSTIDIIVDTSGILE